VTRYLQRPLVRLELPHRGLHGLRHAFATLMIESGEDLGTVSRILGHADFATTRRALRLGTAAVYRLAIEWSGSGGQPIITVRLAHEGHQAPAERQAASASTQAIDRTPSGMAGMVEPWSLARGRSARCDASLQPCPPGPASLHDAIGRMKSSEG
jgi:hypothetical protein